MSTRLNNLVFAGLIVALVYVLSSSNVPQQSVSAGPMPSDNAGYVPSISSLSETMESIRRIDKQISDFRDCLTKKSQQASQEEQKQVHDTNVNSSTLVVSNEVVTNSAPFCENGTCSLGGRAPVQRAVGFVRGRRPLQAIRNFLFRR
jgi:hypothetical protein